MLLKKIILLGIALLLAGSMAAAADVLAVLKVTPEPRGAGPGEQMAVKVLVANYSDGDATAEIDFIVDLSGFSGPLAKQVSVPANSTVEFASDPFALPADAEIGTNFYITATASAAADETTPADLANNSARTYASVTQPQAAQNVPEMPVFLAPLVAVAVLLAIARGKRGRQDSMP